MDDSKKLLQEPEAIENQYERTLLRTWMKNEQVRGKWKIT